MSEQLNLETATSVQVVVFIVKSLLVVTFFMTRKVRKNCDIHSDFRLFHNIPDNFQKTL